MIILMAARPLLPSRTVRIIVWIVNGGSTLCMDEILEAVYTSVQDNAVKGTKTDIFLAALTTCHARLKLYESLDTLQKQILY